MGWDGTCMCLHTTCKCNETSVQGEYVFGGMPSGLQIIR